MRKCFIVLAYFLGFFSASRAQSILQPIPLPIRESVVAPFLSPNGEELFFSIRNFQGNLGGAEDKADIFKVKRNAEGVPDSELFTLAVFNSTGEDVLYGISADVKRFYLSTGTSSGSSSGGPSLSVAGASSFSERETAFRLIRVNDKEEAMEEKQLIDGWNAGVRQEEFFVSSHQHLLIMVQRDKSSHTDLFLSFRKDEENWEEPILLPAGINSPADEISPFLAADQRSLYFASNRENPAEYKLYMSRRINEGWEDWSEPVQLDAALNDAPYNTHLRITPQDPSGVVLKARSASDRSYLFRVELDPQFHPMPVNRVEITLDGVKKIRGGRTYELHLLHQANESLEGRDFVYADQKKYAFFLQKGENYLLRLLNHKGEMVLEQALASGNENIALKLDWEE
jgi:hypothetical protein